MRRTVFPIVADDEPILEPSPQMSLYDESDLISNIKGHYQEKEYDWQEEPRPRRQESHVERDIPEDLLPPLFHAEPSPYSRRDRMQKTIRPAVLDAHHPDHKTQGQIAREQAREDLKKKRSAAYLKDEKPTLHSQVIKAEPTAHLVKKRNEHLTQLADRLRQTTYILADMPAVYSLDKEDRGKEVNQRKNSYDFLKKSQIYNYPERKINQERRMAQELNLTHMEEEV
jgi:hypothetical protein